MTEDIIRDDSHGNPGAVSRFKNLKIGTVPIFIRLLRRHRRSQQPPRNDDGLFVDMHYLGRGEAVEVG